LTEKGCDVASEDIPLIDHVKALLAQMDLRYQQRFDAQTLAINAALQAAKEAVTKAETATERRFEGVNEFRKTLADQSSTFLPRPEYNAAHGAITEHIRGLAERMNRADGRSTGHSDSWGYVVGAAGLILAIATLIFHNAR
jgi:hypothetical protein